MKLARLFAGLPRRRELISVLALWAVLLAASATALVALNMNSVRLINHIEYVQAGRYIRMLALYEEAAKRADRVFSKAGQAADLRISPQDDDYQAAIQLYDRALELDPRGRFTTNHSLYYQVLMRLHEATGSVPRALEAAVFDALTRQDYASATDFSDRLTALAPERPESWQAAAETFLQARKSEQAENAISQLALTSGETALLHKLRGRLALLGNDRDGAIREFDLALKLEPEAVDLRKRLAELISVAGQKDRALALLLEGETLGGDGDGNYMHLLGEALLEAGREKEAVRTLQTAVTLAPHSGDVHWSLAKAHQQAGVPRRAERSMQRAFALKPELRQRVLTE